MQYFLVPAISLDGPIQRALVLSHHRLRTLLWEFRDAELSIRFSPPTSDDDDAFLGSENLPAVDLNDEQIVAMLPESFISARREGDYRTTANVSCMDLLSMRMDWIDCYISVDRDGDEDSDKLVFWCDDYTIHFVYRHALKTLLSSDDEVFGVGGVHHEGQVFEGPTKQLLRDLGIE